jgi:hypothetical protein
VAADGRVSATLAPGMVKKKLAPLPIAASAQIRPPVAMHDPLRGGQADAGARKLRRRVQPLERREQVGRKLHVESSAVVADTVRRGATATFTSAVSAAIRVRSWSAWSERPR